MGTNEQSKADAVRGIQNPDANRLQAARQYARSRQEAADGEEARERPNDLGGLDLQLGVNGSIPGYKLIWENDDNGAIEKRLQEGFDFVTQAELYECKAKVVADLDITSVESRFVKGTRTDGSALRAYLMKVPEEVWNRLEARRYEAADKWDREIRKQAESPDPESGLRKLKGVKTDIDTAFRKEY